MPNPATADASATLADGSTTLETPYVAQVLFGGGRPHRGFLVANPDAANDLWLNDAGEAEFNGVGSIRVTPGAVYVSPAGYSPLNAVSVVGRAPGQAVTARAW